MICLIWGFFAVACVCCDHFVCVCCLCDMPGFLISLFSSLYSSWFISLYSHLFIPRGFISLYSHLFISHLSIPISLFCWEVSRKWCFTPPPFPLNVTLNVVPEISQLRFAHRAVSDLAHDVRFDLPDVTVCYDYRVTVTAVTLPLRRLHPTVTEGTPNRCTV